MTTQDDGKLDWYRQLIPNERRIVDFLIANGIRCVISRPLLVRKLCRKGSMDQRTLTDRLNYLIDRGIIFEVGGNKGATGYGFNFLLDNPEWKRMIGEQVDSWSPKKWNMIIIPSNRPITDHRESIDGLRKMRDSIDQWYEGSRDQKRKMKDIYNIAIEDEKRRLREQEKKG